MKYNWNIHKIMNSSLNTNEKDIIIGEDTNHLSSYDSSTFNYANINSLLYSLCQCLLFCEWLSAVSQVAECRYNKWGGI